MVRQRVTAWGAAVSAAALLALVLSAPASVRAASPGSGSVNETSPTVSWQGTFIAAANTGSSLSGCFDAGGRPHASPTTTGTGACDYFVLDVGADAAYWTDRTGGVTVKLAVGPADDLDLYVYRRNADGTRGDRVQGSERGLGASETVFVNEAAGSYYVVILGYTSALGSYTASATFASEEASSTKVKTGPTVASYLHNLSQPIPGVTVQNSIVEQHRVRMADGVHLDAWIVRPRIDGRVPVVLQVTPYYGGGSPVLETGGHLLGAPGNTLVPRGYAYGMVSVRGTGNSEGCFSIGGPQEAKDTATVVEYFAAQPWANGNVGMMGVSYDGTTPQDVWVEAPPSLKTIVPISGISDLYKYNFVNGVPIDIQGFGFNTYYWALVGLSPAGLYIPSTQLRDPVHVPGAVIGEVCTEQVWVQEGGVSSTIDGNKDGYWQLRDFLAEYRAAPKKPRASVFYIHGLQDWNVKPHNMEDWLTALQESGVPFKAWLGQWAHAYPSRGDWWGNASQGTPSVLVAWFDQFLKGRSTGILDAPKIQLETDRGEWRHENEWLKGKTKLHNYGLRGDGTMATKVRDAGGTVSYFDYNGGLTDGTVDNGPDRVVWVSEPLASDLYISGMPRFEATVTASGRRASLMLTLAERTANGDRPFNFAALSLNHARNLASGSPDISGQAQQVGVNFFPQDDVVRAGSRLVLIASGNVVRNGQPGPTLQPVSDGSVITIDLAGAVLRIPVDLSVTIEK
ncbi:MAG TPA: CocE/NonD family hydrolase [Vicinamibacterales bacterium]|nr:CocE/NonD family hydrolase [Vicinamibacterales bacterium]